MKFGGLSMTLGVAAAVALLIVGASLSTTAGSNPDADGDGVVDLIDNCLGRANPVNAQGWQDDCDLDGFGDECDADYNNDGVIAVPDYLIFGQAYKKLKDTANWNGCVDMNTDGVVAVPDFLLFGQGYASGAPGPSGLKCADTAPGSPNLTGQQRCWFVPNHRVKCPHDNSGAAAEDADDNGILTDPATCRDLRFINHQHYGDNAGSAGAHCVY